MTNTNDINRRFNQAVAAHGQGRLGAARAGYETVLKMVPGNVEALKRLALVHLQSGDAAGGFAIIKKAQALKPKSKSVIEILAAAAVAAKNFTVAVQCFETLTRVDPKNPLYYSEWSKAEYELGNLARAIARYRDFLDRAPERKPEQAFVLGRLYFRNRQPLAAAECLDQALAGGVKTSELLAIRANCFIHEGKEREALQFFEEALRLDPDNVEAHYQHRALIETKKGDPIFAHLEGLKGNPKVAGTVEINLYFLLGNLYQKIGESETAFENYAEANRKTEALYAAEGIRYDGAEVAAEFARLTGAFSAQFFKSTTFAGSASEAPVFIVGMPRSGTTLLEQIITSHPQAEGRGELAAMHYIHVELEEALKRGERPEEILKAKGAEWQKRYLEALAPGPGALRVSDKLPANFRSLGLIAALFPKARIIHIRRNPLDTGVSIFCNLFDKGHPYATALLTIGDYTRRVDALMAAWKSALPVAILEVEYEALVANQEQVSRTVIDFLGLPWDPACLTFHEKDTAAMTLSSIQVRRPMTASSVARWRRFEKHLAPLKEGLGEALASAAERSSPKS